MAVQIFKANVHFFTGLHLFFSRERERLAISMCILYVLVVLSEKYTRPLLVHAYLANDLLRPCKQ